MQTGLNYVKIYWNESSAINKLAKKKHYAHLWDRIAVYEQLPQRYGTQFDAELKPHFIEGEDKVDQRRESMGLGTIKDAIAAIRKKHRGT